MAVIDPVAELHSQFSSDDALPTPWAVAREHLEKAEIFWITTVRRTSACLWLSGSSSGYGECANAMSVWVGVTNGTMRSASIVGNTGRSHG